tara:strand:- start:9506 stop:10984 length:1479 start_codon:yes stop_codon:yes gene_type:complete
MAQVEPMKVTVDPTLEQFTQGTGYGTGDGNQSVSEVQQALIDGGWYEQVGAGATFTNYKNQEVSQVDGRWGPTSQAALDAYNAQRTYNTEHNAIVDEYYNTAGPVRRIPDSPGEGHTWNPSTWSWDPPKKKAPVVSLEQLKAEFIGLYPWAAGWADKIIGWVQDGLSGDGLLANLRASDEWKLKFPGMYTEDGSMRFRNEAEYMITVEDYREQLKGHGFYDSATESATDYSALMTAGIDANELGDRLGTWRELESGSQELRDAFFIHAGLDVTVDDLFEAVIDPEKKKLLEDAYNAATTTDTMDYETFIQRATTVGVERLTKSLGALQESGQVSEAGVRRVLQMEPWFAQNLMGAIWQNTSAGGQSLNLEELESAFEYAVLGSAATEAGFSMPDTETLEKFISQGIDGARLRTAYNSLGQRKSALQGMMRRASGGTSVTTDQVQSEFEGSILGESSTLRYAQSAESALGQAGGGFAAQRAGNRLAQPGRSVR